MLPPNAYWKGFLRFGQVRLRSVSSQGTGCTPSRGIVQKTSLHSRIPIPTGSTRQASARRQYISPTRASLPSLAIFRGSRDALNRTPKHLGGPICYRDGARESTSRKQLLHGRTGKHDLRSAAGVKEETTLTGRSSAVAGVPFLRPSPREPSIHANSTDSPLASLSTEHILEHQALLETELKTGDPVKRDITPNRRSTTPSTANPATLQSLTLHKAVPALPEPSSRPVITGPDVKYQDILEGLQLGLAAILDSDVDLCVKGVVSASARRFMADIAALGELRGK